MAYPLTFSFFSRKFDTCERRNQRSETRLIIHSHMHTFSTFVNFPVERLAVYACVGVDFYIYRAIVELYCFYKAYRS